MAKRINIPNVTGNVVITARTSASSGGSDPVSGDVLSYMTYGRGINLSTGVITDNPECWATVNSVTITNGKTYTMSVDAPYLWVLAINDSGDPITPFLTTGTNSKPQRFTFTATTSKIKFGCYDPDHTATYCTLTENSSGSITSYTITRNLSYCSSSNTSSNITVGSSYSTTITANSGYTLGSITVTMGGTNITSSAVSGNRITISSVTGNVVISCTATSSSSGGGSTPSTGGGDLTGTYLFFGDSICAGGGANGYGYPEAVKAVQSSMTKVNYAKSGTCIAKNDSYDVKYPSILSRIQGSTPYADYIVLEGGFNDSWGQRNPLGTLKSGSAPTTAAAIKTYSASLNEYQYTDALEKCICEIKLKYWGKKIFFVVPHTVNAATYANTYHLRAIDVCKKWGVIVIDLRNCGMPAYKDGTYNVDGTHPSAAGYDKYFAPNIIKVLKENK